MKIEPCPYCGGPAEVGGLFPWVECNECDASGPVSGSECEAVQAWNRVARLVNSAKAADCMQVQEGSRGFGEVVCMPSLIGKRVRLVLEVES